MLASLMGLTTSNGTPSHVQILVFGVPEEALESHLGENTPIANFVDIFVDGRWRPGRELVASLRGRVVQSGNAYHVGAVNLVEPGHPTPEDILQGEEAGITLPLKVVEARWDPITMVFDSDGSSFSTYFSTVRQLDLTGKEVGPGVIFVRNTAWIGRYVLENGVMVRAENGWVPGPISVNSQARIDGSIYDCSLVYVYYFHWTY